MAGVTSGRGYEWQALRVAGVTSGRGNEWQGLHMLPYTGGTGYEWQGLRVAGVQVAGVQVAGPPQLIIFKQLFNSSSLAHCQSFVRSSSAFHNLSSAHLRLFSSS